MKQLNSTREIKSTITHSNGSIQKSTVDRRSGTIYGKVSDGAGIFKLSYEGENPIHNYVRASFISVARYMLIASVSAAVPIIVSWGLKKLNIIGDKSDGSKGSTSIPEHSPALKDSLVPHPTCRSFKEDVAAAIRAGRPKNLLCEEIHESSRVIIFSGPGVGKTIIADQMGFGISTGKPCGIFPNEITTNPQKVLLIDTEQEETDLYIRYGNGLSEIPDNMDRVSNCNFNTVEEVIEYIRTNVESWNENGTVIIDNITSSFSLQSPEKIRVFYNQLKAIQDVMKNRGVIISYIILCHQTKSSKKLTLQALQGSGNIGNFATAVYGIEKINENFVKFKVLKNRRSKNNGRAYIEKFCKSPYFHFEFQGVVDCQIENEKVTEPIGPKESEDVESVHSNGRKLNDVQIEEMRQIYESGKMTINQLHLKFGVNNRTVRKYLGLKH